MAKHNLVIVESPTKAKTIRNFLADEFTIVSSMGHIRDLPVKVLGLDVKDNFKATYAIIAKKKKIVALLRKHYKENDFVYIATDGDREGEGIAWHIKEVLKIPDSKIKRTVFHEITKTAIRDAFKNPGVINMNLVNAYKARRFLDRLVGYQISPILWKKIAYGLSAGRVQSVALKMIVEREKEIRNFKPEKYWKVGAEFEHNGNAVSAELVRVGSSDAKEGKIFDGKLIKEVSELEGRNFGVSGVGITEKKLSPPGPFITSTLQQQANTNFGFSSKKTMAVAQQLYEGVDLPTGRTGLITYMRTDSLSVAKQAQVQARKFIEGKYGLEFLPAKIPFYKTKAAHSQEAHEAIRPVDVNVVPSGISENLSGEQNLLYDMIWRRFVASQMAGALQEIATVHIDGENYFFRASQSVLKKAGFITLFRKRIEEDKKHRKIYDALGKIKKGDAVKLLKIETTEHETLPPPHYNDASIVKILEEKGIGRPSTYASIIETLLRRKYVVRNKKQILLREIGEVVSGVLDEHFPLITDYNFTSGLEEKLDDIANAKTDDIAVLKNFYKDFLPLLEKAKVNIKPLKRVTDRKCPWCGSMLVEKVSKNGKFLYCSGFPACVYRIYFEDGKEILPEKKFCGKCGAPMVLRVGRLGYFNACSKFPKCRNIVPFNQQAAGK
ncbi:MAG: type I DNA topoisomerase [bacterium]